MNGVTLTEAPLSKMIGQLSGSLTLKAHAKRAARHSGHVLEYFKSKCPVMLCGTTEYIKCENATRAAAAGLNDFTNCARRLAVEDEGAVDGGGTEGKLA